MIPTRLRAEGVVRAVNARRQKGDAALELADCPLGDAYYSGAIDLSPDPEEVEHARALLEKVDAGALPEFNALNGATPLFFDYRVRALGEAGEECIVLFFALSDLRKTYERLACFYEAARSDSGGGGDRDTLICPAGGVKAQVTDLQAVEREMREGGPSDYTRVVLRGNVATR